MPEQTPKPSTQDVEKMLSDYQMLQEQIRSYSIQVNQLSVQKSELDAAKDEVSKAAGKIFVTIGGVIVETDKQTALKNIQEKSETGDVRISSMNKQLSELRSKEKQMREAITKISSQLNQ